MLKIKNLKSLKFGIKTKGGRNKGTIAVPRRGALVKQTYRFLDTKRTLFPGTAIAIIKRYIYDPNRSGKISLVLYPNGILSFVLAPEFPIEQTTLFNLTKPANFKEKGWSNYLKIIPLGSVIFNFETNPGMGAKLVRAAGNSAILLRKDEKFQGSTLVKLKSGEHRLISSNAVASVGTVSNHTHFLRNLAKAGTVRLQGRRPRVRPSVMNPVDHPMGGRTKGGVIPQNKTGRVIAGRSPRTKKAHNLILVTARKSRKQRIS